MNTYNDYKSYKKYKKDKKEHGKTYLYVFNHFAEQILSGELKVGDKVPPEREIAEKLDVSRNSIREVMHMLEINGFLECRQGSGNYVRCEPKDYMVSFFNMVMALYNINYTEVYHIRMGFETVALKLAMTQATPEEIEALHNILLQMDEINDAKESAQLDIEFHNRLIEASHNRLIILYSSMIRDLMNLFIVDFRVKIMEEPQRAKALHRAHWNIYDSLVSKDFLAGSFAMQNHFDIIGRQMDEMQEQLDGKKE